MFKIAICDDEEIFIHTLKENLDRYAADTGVEFCCQTYADGSELLAKYQPDLDFYGYQDGKAGRLKNGGRNQEDGQ